MNWGHEHLFKTCTHLTWGSWDFSVFPYFWWGRLRGDVEKRWSWEDYVRHISMRLLWDTEASPWEMLDELVPRPVSWLWRQAVHTPVSNTCLPVSRLSPLSSPSSATSVECYTSKIPWRAPLCLSKQIPSLTDPLRLQFSNMLWNTKSHLPNELWQWDLPCLPVVRALPGCLSQSLLDEPFLCTIEEKLIWSYRFWNFRICI